MFALTYIFYDVESYDAIIIRTYSVQTVWLGLEAAVILNLLTNL